jgi:DNA polymerase V
MNNRFNEIKFLYPNIINQDRSINPDAILQLPKKIRKELLADPNIAYAMIEQDGYYIKYLDKSFRANKDLILKAIEEDSVATEAYVYLRASKSLRKDKDVILAAAREGGLEYLPTSLKSSKEFAIELLSTPEEEFTHAELVAATCLSFFNEDVVHDLDVLRLIFKHGPQVNYCDFPRDVLLELIRSMPIGFWAETDLNSRLPWYVRNEEVIPLLEDREIVLAILENSPKAHEKIFDDSSDQRKLWLQDKNFQLQLLTFQIKDYIGRLDQDVLKSKEFILEAVSRCGLALEYADESLRSDEEVVLKAIQQNLDAFEFAGTKIKNEEYLINLALQSLKEIVQDQQEVKAAEVIKKKQILNQYVKEAKNIIHEREATILENVDLNKELFINPKETILLRASGNSMQRIGIFDKSILIVDKALDAKDRDIVLVCINQVYCIKRLQFEPKALLSENLEFDPILFASNNSIEILGVVTASILEYRN